MDAAAGRPIHIQNGVQCADFIGRDQVNIRYGYSAEDIERLIEKVLAFLTGGAVFLPAEGIAAGGALQAEAGGERLVFPAEALQRLASFRNPRAYLLALLVKREYQVWATKFVPLAARMDVRQAAVLDIPVAFSEFRLPPPGSGPEAQPTSVHLEDITQALAAHSAFIILGEPGSGKTTTLQKIAFESARAGLAGLAARLPLYVRLSQQAGRDPYTFLQTEWERRTGRSFAEALAAGQALILADGINELPRGPERAAQLKAWRLFGEDYAAANPIVFTSRTRDYDQQLDLPRVLIEPLDEARIDDYLERNQAQGLRRLLDDPRTRLRPMASNPFNLCLLAYAYKSDQRAMANRGHLLDWFVGALFQREKDLAHPGWIECAIQSRALAELAYKMQRQGESTIFPYAVARAAVIETTAAWEAAGSPPADCPPDELFRFGRAAGLLDAGVAPEVRFTHQIIQEYFAALALLHRFESGEKLESLWRAPRLAAEMPPAQVGEWDALPEPPATGWEETTIVAAGLMAARLAAAGAPDGSLARLLEAVQAGNPALAGRCLDEAGLPGLPALRQAVRQDLLGEARNPAVHVRARLQAGHLLGRLGHPELEPQEINGTRLVQPPMVAVPAGRYRIGSPPDDPQAYKDESPQHPQALAGFAIGRWPVTNAEYACFIEAGGYQEELFWEGKLAREWLQGTDVTGGQFATWVNHWKWLRSLSNPEETLRNRGDYSPQDISNALEIASWSEKQLTDQLRQFLAQKSRRQPAFWTDERYNNPAQPVVGVTWFEARAYCAWLSEATGQAYRLPGAVEWEAAACGDPPRSYPWGEAWEVEKANTIEGRVLKPSPVGVFAAAGGCGPFGAEDQAGNVWEWTGSLYRPYPYQPAECELVDVEGEREVRGGAWDSNRRNARCAYRDRSVPGHFGDFLGFRVLSPG